MTTPETIAAITTILPFLHQALAALLPLTRLALMTAWKSIPFLLHHLPLMLHLAQSCVYGFAFWVIHCGGHAPEQVYFASSVLHGSLGLLLHRRMIGEKDHPVAPMLPPR